MDTSLENTWKTIIDTATIDDTEVTYKTNKQTNTNDLHELPTISLNYLKANSVKNMPKKKETITITALDEIDTMASTEQVYISGDDSVNMTVRDSDEESSISDIGLDMDSVQPTFIGDFSEEDDEDNDEDDFREDETVVLPLITHNKIVNKNIKNTIGNAPSFEIYEEIARGGMGIVLKGQQNSLKRNIAVKKLIDQSGEKSNKTKFIMEARVTAYLDHPNIIPIHELGIDSDGNPIITMKLIKGKSWKQVLDENQDNVTSLEFINEQLNVLANVCNALSYAHSKKIIHNDLKPANIMIGEFGEVFLMDWGISISIEEDIKNAPTTHKTEVDSPMGTPGYIAPELANGEGELIGTWTDTYLLGGILYCILMGKAPHHGGNVWESIRLSSEGNIPHFSPQVPDELKQICTKALQKDTSKRYQTVEDLKKAIQAFQSHRESIELAKDADDFLQMGEKILEILTTKQKTAAEIKDEYPNPYCPLSRALFGFEEALRIWPENVKAKERHLQAFCVYTRIAILHQDFHVAGAVLGKVYDPKQAAQIKKELEAAMEHAHSCVESAKKDKRLMAKIIGSALALLALGIMIGKLL